MKLLQIGKKSRLAFDFEGNGRKTWTYCSPNVIEYVTKNFKVGDEVTPIFGKEEKEGMKYVVKVTKGTIKTTTTTKQNSQPKCEDCGKVLKDAKYKKCYECNKKNPTLKQETTSTAKDELIKREAVAHAASRVMIGLQGQIDPNNVHEVYEAVYNTILELVEKK